MHPFIPRNFSNQAKSMYDSQKQASERMKAQAQGYNPDKNRTEYDKAIKRASSPFNHLKQSAIDIDPSDVEVVL